MWEEYPIARKSVKVPAEALEWSLASEEVVNPVCPMMNIQLDRRSQELVDLSTVSHGSTPLPRFSDDLLAAPPRSHACNKEPSGATSFEQDSSLRIPWDEP